MFSLQLVSEHTVIIQGLSNNIYSQALGICNGMFTMYNSNNSILMPKSQMHTQFPIKTVELPSYKEACHGPSSSPQPLVAKSDANPEDQEQISDVLCDPMVQIQIGDKTRRPSTEQWQIL